MHKKISIMLISFLLLVSIITPTLAETSKQDSHQSGVIFQSEEIKDAAQLQYRMNNGITDDLKIKIKAYANGDVYIDKSGNKYNITVTSIKTTSQKLKETKTSEGTKNDFVANTEVQYSLVPMNYGSSYENAEDIKTSASLYQTTYYSYYTDVYYQGIYGTTYKLTQTTAKLVQGSPDFVLVQLRIQQVGTGSYCTIGDGSGVWHNATLNDTRTIAYPSNNTYYTITPVNTNYWWIVGGLLGGAVHGDVYGTVKRGTSYYYFNTQVGFY